MNFSKSNSWNTIMLIGVALILCYPTINAQFKTKWDNGYKVESEDGAFKMKFGGRIMYDFAAFGQDDEMEDAFGEFKNGVEFRRLRFFNSGTVYSNVGYKLQIEFSGGKVVLKDAFIDLKKIPGIGVLRIGHFKEPYRLEVLTSSKYMTFMERSLGIGLTPERNTGIMVLNQTSSGKLNWQLGLFRNGNSAGDDKDAGGGINLTGRLAGVIPFDQERSDQFIHVGASFSLRNQESEEYGISSRPETHLGPKYLSTGTIENVDNVNLIGLEAALVSGPFSLQSEFMQSKVNLGTGSGQSSFSLPTFYAQASYFLTGESRKYKYKGAFEGFDRVKPKQNFGSEGSGAWEIALRYSNANWNDGDLTGGKLNDITLGVNWYLNPVSRIMANYILANLDDVGKTNIFQMRMQLDF